MTDKNSISITSRLGLSRVQAANYIGISTSLFDVMVRDGRLPKPMKINARLIWSRTAIEIAFEKLASRLDIADATGETP